jgi:hypothetical protein
MSTEGFHQTRWKNTSSTLLMLVVAFLAGAACNGDGGTGPSGPSGPFRLTFSLDATFQGPHGGQPVSMAVVRDTDEFVVAQTNGTVSATQNPSFSFAAGAVLEEGIAYAVHYWIDSNFDGGTLGVCDPREIDHQWSTEIPSPSNDVTLTVSHSPALTENVCGTFN